MILLEKKSENIEALACSLFGQFRGDIIKGVFETLHHLAKKMPNSDDVEMRDKLQNAAIQSIVESVCFVTSELYGNDEVVKDSLTSSVGRNFDEIRKSKDDQKVCESEGRVLTMHDDGEERGNGKDN